MYSPAHLVYCLEDAAKLGLCIQDTRQKLYDFHTNILHLTELDCSSLPGHLGNGFAARQASLVPINSEHRIADLGTYVTHIPAPIALILQVTSGTRWHAALDSSGSPFLSDDLHGHLDSGGGRTHPEKAYVHRCNAG